MEPAFLETDLGEADSFSLHLSGSKDCPITFDGLFNGQAIISGINERKDRRSDHFGGLLLCKIRNFLQAQM